MSRNYLSILFLLSGTVLFLFFVSPEFTKMRNNQRDLAELSSISSEVDLIAADRDRLIDIYNSIPPESLERIEEMITTGPKASSFLAALEFLAVKNGLFLKRLDFIGPKIAPSTPSRGSVPGAVGAVSPIKPAGESFEEFPLSIVVEGSYESFRSYIKDLEKNIRLLDVMETTFGSVRANIFEFTLRAKSYYQ